MSSWPMVMADPFVRAILPCHGCSPRPGVSGPLVMVLESGKPEVMPAVPIRAITSGWPTARPEPYLYASQNPVCAGIVDRFAILSEGGWDAFSKTPTASNSVICFRVELHLGAEPTRHSRADTHAAKGLPFPCRGCCSRWDRWRNGNGKSARNRRILLPSQRSESAGALVPATPGSLAHTIERRGSRLGARGRPHRDRKSVV